MDNPPKLYMARMPDVFGVGITCFSFISDADAKHKVKAEYVRAYWSQNRRAPDESFASRWEFYGGHITEINTDKAYDEFCH